MTRQNACVFFSSEKPSQLVTAVIWKNSDWQKQTNSAMPKPTPIPNNITLSNCTFIQKWHFKPQINDYVMNIQSVCFPPEAHSALCTIDAIVKWNIKYMVWPNVMQSATTSCSIWCVRLVCVWNIGRRIIILCSSRIPTVSHFVDYHFDVQTMRKREAKSTNMSAKQSDRRIT